MLIAMTFNISLILVIVISLSFSQLILVELQDIRSADARLYGTIPPLLDSHGHIMNVRSRPRPRPDSIYIHPSESNIARADAIALELGKELGVSVENGHKEGEGWQPGRGEDAAMALLSSQPRPLKSPVSDEEADLSD